MNGLEIAMRSLYLLYIISVSLIYSKTIYVNLSCEQIREYETVCMKNTAENHTYNGKIEAINPNGLEVKISYIDKDAGEVATHTDKNGNFNAEIKPNKVFYVSVKTKDVWRKIGNKIILKITSTGKESWREFNTHTRRWVSHKHNFSLNQDTKNIVIGSPFKKDKYTLDFSILSRTSFKLTPDKKHDHNRGASITLNTEKNALYKMVFNTSIPVKVWFSDITTGTYKTLTKPKAITETNKDIEIPHFQALGEKTYIYFAPKSSNMMIVKNISVTKIQYPQIHHGAKRLKKTRDINGTIVWGDGYANHKKNEKFFGEVKIKSKDWEYVVFAENGDFNFNVSDIGEFVLSAYDGDQSNKYPNTFMLNEEGQLFEKRGNKWAKINSLNDVHLK